MEETYNKNKEMWLLTASIMLKAKNPSNKICSTNPTADWECVRIIATAIADDMSRNGHIGDSLQVLALLHVTETSRVIVPGIVEPSNLGSLRLLANDHGGRAVRWAKKLNPTKLRYCSAVYGDAYPWSWDLFKARCYFLAHGINPDVIYSNSRSDMDYSEYFFVKKEKAVPETGAETYTSEEPELF